MFLLDMLVLFLQLLQQFGLLNCLSLNSLRAVQKLFNIDVYLFFKLTHLILSLCSVLFLILFLFFFSFLLLFELILMCLLPYLIIHLLSLIKCLIKFLIGRLIFQMCLIFATLRLVLGHCLTELIHEGFILMRYTSTPHLLCELFLLCEHRLVASSTILIFVII